jgi:hypothetical protein
LLSATTFALALELLSENWIMDSASPPETFLCVFSVFLGAAGHRFLQDTTVSS